MIRRNYIVTLIDGDYAVLEDGNKESIRIARELFLNTKNN